MTTSLRGPKVTRIDTDDSRRKHKLLELVGKPELRLREFLAAHHQAFSINPGERGETDLVQIEVDAGDASQPVRRMPFAVRQEVAKQLRSMQESGIIRPSSSPWASPVTMVRKDHFCTLITAPSMLLLSRISTPCPESMIYWTSWVSLVISVLSRLSHGVCQIRVHPSSVEKTAFLRGY